MTKKQKSEDKLSNDSEIVEEIVGKLLKLMGTKANVTVKDDEENNAVMVDIDDKEEAGLIIGNRGRTLLAIQNIAGQILRRRKGEWKRIIIDVSDWREKEEERLKILALQTADRAKVTGEPQHLYNLTPSQRRVIHMALSQDTSIETESQGEGKDRYLIITPK